jgi:hypothetical protein
MPDEKTRAVLKTFGIAVTDYADAREKGALPEQLAKVEAEMLRRFEEVKQLIENLRGKKD